MHIAEEEFYVFLRFADGDISQALIALDHLPEVEADFLRLCLLKDAAISYCRPFKKSRGAFNKSLKLDNSYVPVCFIGLHTELVDLRDQVFAHTDIDVRSPVLHCWTREPKPIFPIQFKSHNYPQLLAREQEMRSLFIAVLGLVRGKQSELEARFPNMALQRDAPQAARP